MNLQGSQRGGAKDLALHLLKDENEHVDIHELRGFVSDNLIDALNEAYAVSRGTKAKQFLFSVSFNPPPEENVSIEDFEAAIQKVEDHFGLTGQPRAIIFHEKNGRRHAHAVWSRIDTENMKAVPLPYTKRSLRDISRQLYIQHGWIMPRGYMNSQERNLDNFTLAQWQQAKRAGKDARDIKTALQDCWAISDTQATFQQALKERGFILVRGDRRGFIAVDMACEPYSISKKWIGLSGKEIKSKLTDLKSLPSFEDAKNQMAGQMKARLSELESQQFETVQNRLSEIEDKRIALVSQQRAQLSALKAQQEKRYHAETMKRQARFRTGFKGLFDRMTGRHRRIKEQNEREARSSMARDRQEKQAMIFTQLDQRRALQKRMERLRNFQRKHERSLERDKGQYEQIQNNQREHFRFNERSQDFERER